jgi:hypothetical protein
MRKGEDGMKNVEMTVTGNILTIKVDLSKEFGPSSSKKSIIIASTEGNVSVPDRQEKVGLNVYPRSEEEVRYEPHPNLWAGEFAEQPAWV